MKFCKFSIFGSLFLVFILINTGHGASNLKEIAHFGNKVLYAVLVNDDVSGSEANSLCTIKNLTLATLDTQVENDAVGRFLKERASRKEKLVHGWLGGSDEQSEGLWYWLYPYNYIKPYRFENWAAGEPIQDDEYNCMYIAPPTKRSGNNGKWRSYYCNERLGMPICMKLTGWRD